MAVHTKLSKANILKIIQNYKLGELINFQGIKEGIENTNYFLRTDNNKFIITIFEKRVDTSRIPFYIDIMLTSKSRGIKCPVPIKDINGEYLNIVKNKKMSVFEFLEGRRGGETTPPLKRINFHSINFNYATSFNAVAGELFA